MYCVGLTGNIGSGKSTVAHFFEKLGITIISADKVAKALTLSHEPAFHDILKHFGTSVLTPEGELNRQHLRQLIFKNANERLWLENLLHPQIQKQIESTIGQITTAYCIIEIPLLTDKSNYPYLNRVLLIMAPHNLQLARLMKRDNSSEEEGLAILATQEANKAKHLTLANDILTNNGTPLELEEKVAALHAKYLQYASEGSSAS